MSLNFGNTPIAYLIRILSVSALIAPTALAQSYGYGDPYPGPYWPFQGWDVSYPDYLGTPAPADYDGDGKADLSVKTDDGRWLIDYASDGFGAWNQALYNYGRTDAHPVPADYDGDGKADLSVKTDDGRWLIDYASDGFGAWNLPVYGCGGPTLIPAPGDYDADGYIEFAVMDTLSRIWHFSYGLDCNWYTNQRADMFPASQPVPADYDGDGRTDDAIRDIFGGWTIDYWKFGWPAGQKPHASIVRPTEGQYFSCPSDVVYLQANVSDAEDPQSDLIIQWFSTMEGYKGKGAQIEVRDWRYTSLQQEVFVWVEDRDGNVTTDAVNITIWPCPG